VIRNLTVGIMALITMALAQLKLKRLLVQEFKDEKDMTDRDGSILARAQIIIIIINLPSAARLE
jgi:hypothetical protein